MSADNTRVKDDFYADMLPDFLDEANENIERLNEHLLELDEQVKSDGGEGFDAAVLNEMFRAAHTLKGLSGMLGLQNINALTHKVENVFDAARSSALEVTTEVVEVVFEAIDRLTEMIGRLKEGKDDAVDCGAAIEEIAKLLQRSGCDRPQTSQSDAENAMFLAAELAVAPQPSANVEPPGTPKPANTEPAVAQVSVADASPSANSTEESNREEESVVPAGTAPPSQTVATVELHAEIPADDSEDFFAAIKDDADLTSKYISIFVDESELTLDELTETLLTGADENVTEKVLVLCHRMKGSAATVGLSRAAKLSHFMEDLLQELHDQGAQLTAEMTDAMLDCTEALRVFVAGLKNGRVETEPFHRASQKLLHSRTVSSGGTKHVCPSSPSLTSAGAPSDSQQPASDATQQTDIAPAAASVAKQAIGLTDDVYVQVATAAPAGAQCYVGVVTFRDDVQAVSLKADLLFGKLANAGDVFYCDPPENRLEEVEQMRTITFGVASEEPIEAFQAKLRVDGIQHVELRAVRDVSPSDAAPAGGDDDNTSTSAESQPSVRDKPAPQEQTAVNEGEPGSVDEASTAPAASRGPDKTDAAKPVETVRVDIDRLDQLMNLAGQLVINKARFAQISGGLRQLMAAKQGDGSTTNIFGSLKRLNYELDSCEQGRASLTKFEDIRAQARRIQSEMEGVQRRMSEFASVRQSVNELLEAVHQLDRVSDGIQKCVMDTRMVPIGPLFTRFKRVIRDISRGKGKEIRLAIHGEKTELDKRMIDELGDPLIHIVRNSADHGIESPDDRVAAGKPREGTVTLDASHRGNSIVIQIRDDGKGLDSNKIRAKAVQKGMMTAADADKLTDQQAYQLIWEPGLSTAEKITEVSGRGMGMDIVRSKIEQINGMVELDSAPGQGTTITIKLPLTLAILPSLLAEIDGDVFAIPVETVSEIVCVSTQDMSHVHGLDTATVRGRVISVVHLPQIFEWNDGRRQATTGKNGDDKTLVIVGDDGREVGLVVHRLLGEEDVVIKSLAENFRNVEGIAGASILGDGRVSLILDVGALVERSSQSTKQNCLV